MKAWRSPSQPNTCAHKTIHQSNTTVVAKCEAINMRKPEETFEDVFKKCS